MQGFILEVSITREGDELDTDQLTDETVIPLVDVSDFLAGTPDVEINGTVYGLSSVDETTNELTLATGLVEDLQAGEPVYTSPVVEEKWANVEISEQDEPILARVGSELYDQIDDGVRDPEDQEQVTLEMKDGDWVVTSIVGQAPTVSGEFIDPETAPTNPEVDTAIDELRSVDTTHSGQLTDILGDEDVAGRLQNLEETAFDARALANAADGRVSMSDYEPAPEDVQYFVTDVNGELILDSEGNPILLNRNEGSIWFTRTRARVNMITNPSFEVDTTLWATSQLSQARTAVGDAVVGSYIVELTNNTAGSNHVYYWDNGGTANLPAAVPGAIYTGSVYARLISGGNGTGYFARLWFFDGADVPIGTGEVGVATQLSTTPDWTRLDVTAVAPANAAKVRFDIVAPAADINAVWQVDAALLEASNILGRYFDGTLYDSAWDGTAHASASSMIGGKIIKAFELDDGAWVEKVFMGDTLVDLDASEITHGELDGDLIAVQTIDQDKLNALPVQATEALLAGNLVHIYNDEGSARVKLADSSLNLRADGFVIEDTAIGAVAMIYSFGYNAFVAGLTPGLAYLSTEGEVSSSPPKDVGTLVQKVGAVIDPTVLSVQLGTPVKIT